MSRLLRALMRVARGDSSGALDDGGKDLAQARRTQDPQAILPSLGTNAYLAVETGSPDTARALLRELFDLRKGLGGTPVFGAPAQVVWAAIDAGYSDEFSSHVVQRSRQSRWTEAAQAMLDGDWIHAAAIYEGMGTGPSSPKRSRSTVPFARPATCGREKRY